MTIRSEYLAAAYLNPRNHAPPMAVPPLSTIRAMRARRARETHAQRVRFAVLSFAGAVAFAAAYATFTTF